MSRETLLLDRAHIDQMMRTLCDELLAQPWAVQGQMPWLIGIAKGGVAVAQELAKALQIALGQAPRVGSLDITFYRDDTWLKGPRAAEGATELPGDLTGERVLLVDDVLFTGRTVRAALNALNDFGRPTWVGLAVLIDRGGRELPIAADAVGHRMAVPARSKLRVACDAGGRLQSVLQIDPE